MTTPTLAVLFDMDGVLIDSVVDHNDAFLAACRKYGFADKEILQAAHHTNTLPEFYRSLQAFRSFTASFEQFSDNILEHLFKVLEQRNLGTDPELITFLDTIRNQGVEVGIATSAIRKSAARKLAIVELHNEFDVLVCADDITNPKPHPEALLKVAELLGAQPQHCVMIGDSQTDITAGQAAGMKTIGFTKYTQDKQQLQGADLLVDSFAELDYTRIRNLLNR